MANIMPAKFNPINLFSIFEKGYQIFSQGVLSFEIWSDKTQKLLNSYQQEFPDIEYYMRAAWKMLKVFPQDKIYNKDIMRSAIEHIGMKINTGENLKTTRVTFSAAYGEDNLCYLETSNLGVLTFPRSYIYINKPKSKKRTLKKKTATKVSTSNKTASKWTSEMFMGKIKTSHTITTSIHLCRSEEDDLFIVIEQCEKDPTSNKPSSTTTLNIPLKNAQEIAITIENAISQAKKI